jgi:uncharacterized protein YcbK (DUF882 family)
MLIIPPPSLRAQLTADVFQRRALHGYPELEAHEPGVTLSRRGFLGAASASLMAFGGTTHAKTSSPLIFSPADDKAEEAFAASRALQGNRNQAEKELQPGEIPPDFWRRPRELWLRRQGMNNDVRAVYWKDGQLQSEGYWAACAILRDVSANVMTAIDPTVLDVLRGISGYYQAWNWPHPIVVTSGYRTKVTNDRISSEGSAKNSMHLYGKAVDLYIPGIPARDVGKLGQYLQQGGVGFYPGRGFTHLDTGRLRTWTGR